MSQLNQNQSPTPRMHILRLFGMDRATLTQLLKEAAAQGCPGLRLLEQNGEQAVCIRARGDSAEDLQLAALWADELERLVRDVCFGRGSDGLPQAFAAALTGREWLVVTPDEATGRLLDPVMESLPQGRALYDFGRQSWADEKTAPRLKPRAGDDRLTGAARSGLVALKATDADLALILLPAAEAEPAAAMAVSGRAAWVRALSGEQAAEAAARNWLLELGRRMALELPAPAGTAEFVPGKRAPELPPLPAPGPVPEVEAPELPVWHAPAPQKSDPEDWRGAPTRAFAEPDSPAAPQEEQLRAALNLYDLAGEEDDGPAPYSRPQKGSWKKVLACLLVVLALCAAAAAYAWTSRNAGQGPSPRGYGTIAFDQAASEYLAGARAKDGQVAAYLALPGQRGALVYSTDEPGAMSAGGAVYADEAEPGQVKPGTRAWLEPGSDPARAHSNTLVWCPGEALGYLDRLDQQEVLAANYGFTLYTPDGVSRCKAAAVFRWNAEGDALPLTELQDLTNYRDYLTFVLGVKARSLFELPVDIRDTDRFVTLLAPTGEGEYLAVVGRMVREDESASVNTAAIAAAEAPLDPADEAAAAASNQKWMGWVIASGETNGQLQEEVGMPEHDLTLEQLLQVLENMPDIQVLPAYTMSPLPTAAPTEEPAATPAATLEPGATASPTPVPTPTPEPTATPGPGETPAPTAAPTAVPTAAPTATPTAAPTPPPSGGAAGMTINVTMNGTRQTMDLVECLAMVCQNELGYHAPAEAVKAQAVAAHSWVLSQGGYPSVSGITPTQTTRDLVAQVATQVVVYNGSVAFTPYYASASYGTCSSQEVWGGVRPYLIPVASPWDEVYATNWRTVKSYPAADLAQRVLERLGEDLYAYSENKADWIGELSKNQYGYVLDMRVGNAHLSGSRFKQYIVNQLCGITLRSAAFDVEYDAGSDSFVFTVLGYGHGCGMSQHGAMGAAKEGWSYSQILAHYYPGTSLAVIG